MQSRRGRWISLRSVRKVMASKMSDCLKLNAEWRWYCRVAGRRTAQGLPVLHFQRVQERQPLSDANGSVSFQIAQSGKGADLHRAVY